jgi:hypothetical protein
MMRDLKWSQAEKAIARKAFNQALEKELAVIICKVKEMAQRIEEPADLWKIEDYLSTSRREIDEKFDYRYSVLPQVFGILVRDGLLKEEDLQGLVKTSSGSFAGLRPFETLVVPILKNTAEAAVVHSG